MTETPCLRCGDFAGEVAFPLPPAPLCERCLSDDKGPWWQLLIVPPTMGMYVRRFWSLALLLPVGFLCARPLDLVITAALGGATVDLISTLALGFVLTATLVVGAMLSADRAYHHTCNPEWLAWELRALGLEPLRGLEGLELDLVTAARGELSLWQVWRPMEIGVLIRAAGGLAFLSRRGARRLVLASEIAAVEVEKLKMVPRRRGVVLRIQRDGQVLGEALRIAFMTGPDFASNNRRAELEAARLQALKEEHADAP